MTGAEGTPKILHCHSTFAAGGKEMRSVQLMNAFGDELDHTIISGLPDQMAARDHIASGVSAAFPTDFPSITGLPTPGRLVAIAQAMQPFDLVLTYNWGAMDVVMANTVFGNALNLPPLVHHEDGFNEDEAEKLSTKRNWYRRIALGRASALVVPSSGLEQIALNQWKKPRDRVHRIPNGINCAAFAKKPKPGSFRVVKREGERWVGTLAGLRAVKQLPLLVRACADLPDNWHLVILGEGPEKDAIQAVADELDISHRVHLPGAVNNADELIGMFDIFALSSKSEQFPLSVVEAMAAGLPIVAPDVGDIKSMVSQPNRPFIAVPNDAKALGAMLDELTANDELRRQIGETNQAKAHSQFDEEVMVSAYRALYWGVMQGRN